MSRARANRYRLRWCRYTARCAKVAGGVENHTPQRGWARAVAPFYRNGALLLYGWQPPVLHVPNLPEG